MITFIQLLFTGLSVGIVYSLVALGFVIIYKSSKIFNFAQGELVMVGAFVTWSFLSLFKMPLLPGFLLSLAIMGVVGYNIERFPFRRMIGQPILAMIMATLALAVFFKGLTLMLWSSYIGIRFPEVIAEKTIYVLGIPFSSLILLNFFLALLLVIALSLLFHYTRIGLHMRAVAENQHVARSMGIRVTRVIAQSWALAAIVCTIAGFLFGYYRGIDFGLAQIGLIACVAGLVGGMESLKGAVVGGLIIGLAETLTGYYIGYNLKEVMPFIVMVIVVCFKPYGLFGLQKIERV